MRDSRVHHRLFIAAEHVGECRLTAGVEILDLGLQECLPQSGDVAVPEDSEAAGEQLGALAVAFGVLVGEEADDSLRNGEVYGRLVARWTIAGCVIGGCHSFHFRQLWDCNGSRGSMSW